MGKSIKLFKAFQKHTYRHDYSFGCTVNEIDKRSVFINRQPRQNGADNH